MLIHHLKLFVPASMVVLSVIRIAGGAELPSELIDCRVLSSSAARLDCYDQFVDAHTAAPNQASGHQAVEDPAPVAPTAATATAESEPKPSQEDLFGKRKTTTQKSVQEATGTKEIDRIEATVTEVRETESGKAVITLDNGQVWIQIDSSRSRFDANDKVTIRRRSFGSYMLYNKNTAIRVRRSL